MRVLLLLLAVSAGLCAKTEILWDSYGVPHIFADSIENMFYAHGWAQTQSHADLLLRLYGESRGRGAEYWGADWLPLDRWLRTNGVPERAKLWYDQQTPEFRRNLDAFARGINDYARVHPGYVSAPFRQVLPVTGVDVAGHSLRIVHYMYMGSETRMKNEVEAVLRQPHVAVGKPGGTEQVAAAGSTTWTIGPSRSASGKAMLLINPHLLWGEFYTYMEVHLVGPGYDLYGSPQIGFPVPVNGFNRRAGWGRTVNTIDTVDFYKLTTRGDEYQFDGAWRPFETATATIRVRQDEGRYTQETLRIRRSVHGPVVFDQDGLAVAMRVAALDRPRMLEQWYRMGGARNLQEFQAALRMGAVPLWTADYADADGHIYLVFNGTVPRRGSGDFAWWNQVVPGDTSKTLWSDYLKLEELPQSLDPPSGFNQNCNEPPWLSTLPALDASRYPAYIAPPLAMTSFRTRRSLRLLTEAPKISYEQLLADKHSTRMELADAVLPDLLTAAARSSDAEVQAAAAVLEAWDRSADAGSRGAVLFQIFSDRHFGTGDSFEKMLRVPLDPAKPLASYYGLARPDAAVRDLAAAARQCRDQYGSLDVPWGAVNRYRRGILELAGNGATGRMGVLRTMQFSRKEGNRLYSVYGDTFVCAVEFSTPQRAECALGYGNSSQPGSRHIEDQLHLLSEKKLHPVWREKKNILLHLEQRETLN